MRDWLDGLRVGDVMLSRSGTARVVREVTRDRSGLVRAVAFTIMRCSWTKRCYTIYTRVDLATCGFRRAGVRVSMRGKFDRRINAEIRRHGDRRAIDCCEVRGVR